MEISPLHDKAAARLPSGQCYAGELTSKEAWQFLESDEKSVLVDVRCDAEWAFVGLPDISSLGKTVIRVSWQLFPKMNIDSSFLEQISASGCHSSYITMFICRSGARSREAANASAISGFSHAYNVFDGFEGPHDELGHRGQESGWKAAGLPWVQS